MKIADLKAFVETKLLSKSDKALEKIGQEESSKSLSERAMDCRRIINVRTFGLILFTFCNTIF